MGNVNESKEKEGFSDEILPESLGCESTFEFDDSESLSSQALEQVASDSDLPIKLFFPSRTSASEIVTYESMAESPRLFEDLENTLQHRIAYTEAVEYDEELSKDDSFPLSDSVLPSSFDLLVETSPILSDSSDVFHTPDNSLDSVEEKCPTGIQNSPGATMDLLFPSPDGNNIDHILEDVHVRPSPLENVYLVPEETKECLRNDDIPFPTQIQVSIEDKVVLENAGGRELCHNIEVCKDLQDVQSESTQIILDGCQLDEGLSLLLFPHQASATGTHNPKEMTKAEVNNSNGQVCEDIENSLSNPTQMFVAEYQSVEDLFSRLSLDQFHVTGIDNLNGVMDGNLDYSNAHASVDIGGSPPELIQMAPVPIADSQSNEDQISGPTLDEESAEESICLNEIQGYTLDAPEFFSGLSLDSDSLEWEYPADGSIESVITSYPQHEIDQHSESDIQFSFSNLMGSDLPLESSNSETQIAVLYSVAPSTTEPSSLETKIKTSRSLDTSEGVIDKDGDKDQDQMDIKLSESPIAISHLLNISPESFIALSEPSQLSDHFATPFSSDLTTPLESRVPFPLYPLLLEDESNNFVTRNTANSLSLDFEGMIDATFLDIINPDILVDMESLEVHSTPLESTNEPIDASEVTSMSAENADVPALLVSDEAHPLSTISDVAQKKPAQDATIPPNSSHKAEIEQPAAYFTYPQHSPERPHWALAPVDPPKSQMIPAKKPVKTESKRTLSRRGKKKTDMALTGKTTKAREARASGHSTMKLETSAHSSFVSASPSNESLEGLRFKSSVPVTNTEAVNSRAVNKFRSNMGSSDLVVPAKSIGRGHRARSGSMSFRQIDPSEKASLPSKGCLPPVDETGTTVKSKEATKGTPSALGDSSFTLGTCENNAEIVKNKITAILSETRHSKPNNTQPLHDFTKIGPGARQIHLAPPVNPPSISDPHKSRLSWPSNEQEFQTNGRPPLPWRAGIGRALSFHPASAHDAQRQLEAATTGDQSRRKSSVEDAHSRHSTTKNLQVGHDEFRLHAREYNQPVRVNLPSPSVANLPRSVSDMTSHPSTRPTFHSHIPVATRITVNRSVGPESDDVLPAVPLSFVNAEGWQSSATFPQAPLVQRVSAPNSSDANLPPVGHRYCTVPPTHSHLQNSARASQSIDKPRLQDQGNRFSGPNLSAQMHHSAGSRASMPAGSGQQPQYPFSAMQRVKSREFLNNAYLHGQYHERKHVESARTNYPGSTAFAKNFHPPADAREWRNRQALCPSDAVVFQDRHYVMNNPTGMPSGSHGNYVPQQEQQYRNFNTYNNIK